MFFFFYDEKSNELLNRVKKSAVNNTINRLDIENEIEALDSGIDIFEFEKYLEEEGYTISVDSVVEESSNAQIETPFNPELIDISMDRIVCINLINRLKNNAFELESDFQRKAGLWTIEQKSRLIESILLKIPLPAFYFDSSDSEKWLVIDGLQRLSTINSFVVKEEFELTNLEFLKDWEGKKFSDLPYTLRMTIEETNFNAYLVRKNTPKNVKYNIFRRINTGGLVLTPQEIRNALYQGAATKFLSKLAKSEKFIEATSNSIKSDRMLDREFCLRYMAFTNQELKSYNNSIDDFLISEMERLNFCSEKQLDKYYQDFEHVMSVSYKIFGRNSFRKLRYDGRRTPINKAIFEGWSVVINKLSDKEREQLIKYKEKIVSEFTNECEKNHEFVNHVKANDKNSIESRLKVFENIVRGVL